MVRQLYGYNLRRRLEQLQRALKNDDQIEEMNSLLKLKADLGMAWADNLTLINEADFEEFARDYAEDLHGDLDQWPFGSIDWEAAASALWMDYKSVEYDEEEWLYQM